MFGFFKTAKDARAARRALTEAFKARRQNFMTMEPTVHEALVKEAIATGVEATMEHLNRIEMLSFGRGQDIIEHYEERSKQFSR